MGVNEEIGQRNFMLSSKFGMCLAEKRRKGTNRIKSK